MEEKKKVKLSLGAIICIFIIVVLAIALGTWYYINTNKETANIEDYAEKAERKADKIQDEEAKIAKDVKYEFTSADNGAALGEAETLKIYELSDNKMDFEYNSGYDFDKATFGREVKGVATLNSENKYEFEEKNAGHTYKLVFTFTENKDSVNVKEYDNGKMISSINLWTLNEKNAEKEEKIAFKDGTYAILGEDYAEARMQTNISFKNNNFTAIVGDSSLIGKYEVKDNKEIECKIESYHFEDEVYSADIQFEDDLRIKFEIVSENEIKVKELINIEGESEIENEIYRYLGEGKTFKAWDVKSFATTWNSKKYLDDDKGLPHENLRDIFGSSIQYGSSLKLLENNKFEDYVFPITEGDCHRKGTYTFDDINKFTFTYDDDSSYIVEVYIVNENTLLYTNGTYSIILEK